MAEAITLEDLIDQYKVEQHVAEKRYTDLYLAYDVDEDRLVELDILRNDFAHQAEFASRFIQRARAIGQIRHPNIPRVFGVGETGAGLPYVAQAHSDAYPLSERLAQLSNLETPVNSIYAIKLVRQAAEALLLADRLDLLHYDLRPHNILLKNLALPSDDFVLLADLYVPYERHTWAEDGSVPEVEFLSPEQRSGRKIDGSSHVYTLGVLLFELLAGQPPQGAVRLADMLGRRLTAGVTPLEKERPGLTIQTYSLVDRALRRDPGQRFETIQAFVAALDEALQAEEAKIGATALTRDGEKRRLAWLVPFLLASLVVVAMVLVVAMVRSRPENLIPPVIAAAEATEQANDGETGAVAGDGGAGSGGAENPGSGGETSGENGDASLAVVPLPAETATVTWTPTNEPTASPTPTATASPTWTTEPTVTPTEQATETSTPVPRVTVSLNSAFLRQGPGTFYPQVGVLLNGEQVQVLARTGDEEDGWYLVQTEGGQLAWLAVSVTEPVGGSLPDLPSPATIPASPTPTATPSPTPTIPPTPTSTGVPSGGGGGGDSGGEQPPPTAPPPTPSTNPTRTPPPLEP